ncbi:MAG: hypothetical protein WBA16_04065 [Nonlabens sp.]
MQQILIPLPHECRKASTSYLMSIMSLVAGLPLPVANLLATVGYYLGYRNDTYFVRWHCVQAILTQIFILPFNSVAFWWGISIYLNTRILSTEYLAYVLFVVNLNVIELAFTIYTVSAVHKGINVRWPVYAAITDRIVSTN